MSEIKELTNEQLEEVSGGLISGYIYSFYDEESVVFTHRLYERISMSRWDTVVYGTITDRGIYKKGTHEYYACYYVDLENVLGDGWFYDDNTKGTRGIVFTNRIESPDKKGL